MSHYLPGHPIAQQRSDAPAYYGGEVAPGLHLVGWQDVADGAWSARILRTEEFQRDFMFMATYDATAPKMEPLPKQRPAREDAMFALFGGVPVPLMPGAYLLIRQVVTSGDSTIEHEATITNPTRAPMVLHTVN